MFQDYQKSFGLLAYRGEVLPDVDVGSRIDTSAPQGASLNPSAQPFTIPVELHQTLSNQANIQQNQSLFKKQSNISDELSKLATPCISKSEKSPFSPVQSNVSQSFLEPVCSSKVEPHRTAALQTVSNQLQIPNISSSSSSSSNCIPNNTPASLFYMPKRSIETEHGKALAQRVNELESMVLGMRGKYEKQIDNYKTQLCNQVESYSKMKEKTKKLKEECKTNQVLLRDQNMLKEQYAQAVQQMEEERQQRLNERQAKSVESRRLLMAIRAELDQQKQANAEAKNQIISRTREKEVLGNSLNQLQQEMGMRDQTLINLKKEVIDITKNYKIIQQQLVEKKFTSASLKLRIAHANCETQITERSKQPNPELYNLSGWKVCQDEIRRIIERNRLKYDQYANSLHQAEDPAMVTFEEEPLCPLDNPSVCMLPVQRYDDILLGRVLPSLPRPHLHQVNPQPTNTHPSNMCSELENIALMLDSLTVASSDCSSPCPLSTLGTSVQDTSLNSSLNALTNKEGGFFQGLATLNNQLHNRLVSTPPAVPSGVARGRGRGRGRNKLSASPLRHPLQSGKIPNTTPENPGVIDSAQCQDITNDLPQYSHYNEQFNDSGILNVPLEPENSEQSVFYHPHSRVPYDCSLLRRPNENISMMVSNTIPQIESAADNPQIAEFPISLTTTVPQTMNMPQFTPQTVDMPQFTEFSTSLTTAVPQTVEPTPQIVPTSEIAPIPQNPSFQHNATIGIHTPPLAYQDDEIPDNTSGNGKKSAKPQLKKQPSLDNNCVICLEDLDLREIHISECAHKFHKDCVDSWFATNNFTCPLCRTVQPDVSNDQRNWRSHGEQSSDDHFREAHRTFQPDATNDQRWRYHGEQSSNDHFREAHRAFGNMVMCDNQIVLPYDLDG